MIDRRQAWDSGTSFIDLQRTDVLLLFNALWPSDVLGRRRELVGVVGTISDVP